MADAKYVQVQNLSSGSVVYSIPEDHVRRVFSSGETKNVTANELRKLYFQPGGASLIHDFLSVKDKDLALELGVSEDSFDHEYGWTVQDVQDVLLNGSLDTLHDALDFAPEGIVDLIVDKAIELRIPDVNKRELIQSVTGKNINSMIATQIALEEALGVDDADKQPKQRRVNNQPTAEPVQGGRRVQ